MGETNRYRYPVLVGSLSVGILVGLLTMKRMGGKTESLGPVFTRSHLEKPTSPSQTDNDARGSTSPSARDSLVQRFGPHTGRELWRLRQHAVQLMKQVADRNRLSELRLKLRDGDMNAED